MHGARHTVYLSQVSCQHVPAPAKFTFDRRYHGGELFIYGACGAWQRDWLDDACTFKFSIIRKNYKHTKNHV